MEEVGRRLVQRGVRLGQAPSVNVYILPGGAWHGGNPELEANGLWLQFSDSRCTQCGENCLPAAVAAGSAGAVTAHHFQASRQGEEENEGLAGGGQFRIMLSFPTIPQCHSAVAGHTEDNYLQLNCSTTTGTGGDVSYIDRTCHTGCIVS